MNRPIGMVLLGALLTLLSAGCGNGKRDRTDANDTTAEQLSEKAGQALRGASDLLAEQKDKLLAAAQEQLAKLEQQVNEWLSEVSSDDEELNQKLTTLRRQFHGALREARQALEKAKESGAEAWQEVKPTVEADIAKVQQAHDDVVAFLKDLTRKENQENQTGPDGQGIIE
ncbi:MAG: hypothetical protein JSW27_19050 [Phycisphaerales bacterium]|nr:MAG: hypothetical protein JSW27_19050 [Phycisphaerales bacterium]